jgi:hypothetical protein
VNKRGCSGHENLEKLVLPTLRSAPFIYEVSQTDNTVTFLARIPRFSSQWQIVDYPKSQVLAIEAVRIVSFTPEATDLLAQVNDHNADCIGKFTLVNQEDLTYCLELPYLKSTSRAAFQHALFLALDTVAAHYEGWRKYPHRCMGLFDRIKEAFG